MGVLHMVIHLFSKCSINYWKWCKVFKLFYLFNSSGKEYYLHLRLLKLCQLLIWDYQTKILFQNNARKILNKNNTTFFKLNVIYIKKTMSFSLQMISTYLLILRNMIRFFFFFLKRKSVYSSINKIFWHLE